MSDPYDVDPLAEALRISAQWGAEIAAYRRVLGEIVACDAERRLHDFGTVADCWPLQSPRLKAALAEARAFVETGPPPAPEPAQLSPEMAALRLQAFAIPQGWVHDTADDKPATQQKQQEWADELVWWALRNPDAEDGP